MELVAPTEASGTGPRTAASTTSPVPFRWPQLSAGPPASCGNSQDSAAEPLRAVSVLIGSTTILRSESRQLGPGSRLLLNSEISSPAELVWKGTPMARVELVEIDGKIGFQVCELLTQHQTVSPTGSHS